MENLLTTIHQVTEGLTATNEHEILPIYYGNELANGAAYTAFRFKRFAQAAGRFTTEVAYNTAHVAANFYDHIGHTACEGFPYCEQ